MPFVYLINLILWSEDYFVVYLYISDLKNKVFFVLMHKMFLLSLRTKSII